MSRKDREEFASLVRGDSYKRYVLGQLRAARARARLMINAIDDIGVALKDGAIDADQALVDLGNVGALPFMQPSEPLTIVRQESHTTSNVGERIATS
jgi:hypothetical protein